MAFFNLNMQMNFIHTDTISRSPLRKAVYREGILTFELDRNQKTLRIGP